jgi:hypothetical protein
VGGIGGYLFHTAYDRISSPGNSYNQVRPTALGRIGSLCYRAANRFTSEKTMFRQTPQVIEISAVSQLVAERGQP